MISISFWSGDVNGPKVLRYVFRYMAHEEYFTRQYVWHGPPIEGNETTSQQNLVPIIEQQLYILEKMFA